MAVTKIWNIKDSLSRVVNYAMNPEKTSEEILKHDLSRVVDYAIDQKKTDKFYYVTGINCIPEIAAQQMEMTKKRYGKEGGNVAFHAYQSFKPGEVTPEKCHEIGVNLAKKLWGNCFEVIVATHLNTDCCHNHFVLNSVSFKDGKRYNDCKASYNEFRNASDEICRENNLSVIEMPSYAKTSRALYEAEKNGKPTYYNIIRDDIDWAISHSFSMKQFNYLMRTQGYILQLNPKRKYWTITFPGQSRPMRLYRLGENYNRIAIENRIRSHQEYEGQLERSRYPVFVKRRRIRMNHSHYPPARKLTGFRALYLRYCYQLGLLPKHKQHKPLSPELRADLLYLDEISKHVRLISKYQISDIPQLNEFMQTTENKINTLCRERSKVYYAIRKAPDDNALNELKSKRDSLTSAITQLRQELKTAKDVAYRSEKIHEKMERINTPPVKERKRNEWER